MGWNIKNSGYDFEKLVIKLEGPRQIEPAPKCECVTTEVGPVPTRRQGGQAARKTILWCPRREREFDPSWITMNCVKTLDFTRDPVLGSIWPALKGCFRGNNNKIFRFL